MRKITFPSLPKGSPKRCSDACLFCGTLFCAGEGTVPYYSQEAWRPLTSPVGEDRTQSSVPGNSAKSLRLDSTYLRIRRVCSVTYVRKKFSHSTDKTQGLFQETSSQSTHISYCVMWTIKSQVIAQLKGNTALGFCPPWLSKLPCPKLSCFSISVASFLPH